MNDDPLEMSWNPSAFGGARAEPSQWRDSPQDHVALNEPLSSDLGDGAAASPATQAARVSLFAHLGEGDGEVGTLANDVDAGRGGGGGDGGGRSGRHGAARGAVSDEDLAIVADERAAEGPDLSAFKGTAPSAEDRAAIAGMMVGEDGAAQPSDAEVAKMADEMAAAGPDLSAFKGTAPSAEDRAAIAGMMVGEDAPAQPSDAEVAKMADEMAAAGPDLSAFKGKPPSAADRAAAAMTMM